MSIFDILQMCFPSLDGGCMPPEDPPLPSSAAYSPASSRLQPHRSTGPMSSWLPTCWPPTILLRLLSINLTPQRVTVKTGLLLPIVTYPIQSSTLQQWFSDKNNLPPRTKWRSLQNKTLVTCKWFSGKNNLPSCTKGSSSLHLKKEPDTAGLFHIGPPVLTGDSHLHHLFPGFKHHLYQQ